MTGLRRPGCLELGRYGHPSGSSTGGRWSVPRGTAAFGAMLRPPAGVLQIVVMDLRAEEYFGGTDASNLGNDSLGMRKGDIAIQEAS